MPRIIRLLTPATSILLLVLAKPLGLFGAESQASSPFWPASTIFVAEIEKANPAKACQPLSPACPTDLVVRAVEILKDDSHQSLVPGEFRATVPSPGGYMSMQSSPWQRRSWDIRAGQRYLIIALGQKGLTASLTMPRLVTLLTDEDDPVSDVKFILRMADLPLKEQVSAATTELVQASGHRSLYFANYVAGLLSVSGDEAGTAMLVQALENSASAVFSSEAKVALLGALNVTMGKPSPLRIRVYVALTARFLIGAPEQLKAGGQGISVAGLLNNVSWILGSEQAKTLLRGILPANHVDQLRRRIADLKKERTLPSEQTARLEEFVIAINPQ